MGVAGVVGGWIAVEQRAGWKAVEGAHFACLLGDLKRKRDGERRAELGSRRGG